MPLFHSLEGFAIFPSYGSAVRSQLNPRSKNYSDSCLLSTVYCLLSLLSLLTLFIPLFSVDSLAQSPHYEHRKHPSEYHGPGRDEPIPEGLTEVLIGYFGPDDPNHPIGGDIWLAANFAIEEINASGGYRGLPFRLVQGWSENPWGTGVSEVTRMVYDHQVWAIIGSIDGPSTHLADQVVAKARVPLLNPGSTDKTANLANVPWLFSFLPGEHLQAPLLAKALIDEIGTGTFAFISSIDHDSRVFSQELIRNLAKRGRTPAFHLNYDSSKKRSLESLESFSDVGIKAIVIITLPQDGIELIKRIQDLNDQISIFGSPFFGRRFFLDDIGKNGNGIVLPYPGRIGVLNDSLENVFRDKWGRFPDFAARQTYDSIRFLAEAIQVAGLNRARIRDAIRELSLWVGSNGVIDWDPIGQNRRSVHLATIQDGKVIELP